MRKLTAVAIDDEPLALEVIERFAGKSEDLNLLMAFENPLEAISFLQDNKVDLILLDIQMPDLTGIQLLESLVYKP
ncbi:MAG: response regulator, partial [Bacteroidota bacterium]